METRQQWDNVIGEIEFAMNNTIQKELGCSTNEVIFGHKLGYNYSHTGPIMENINDILQIKHLIEQKILQRKEIYIR